MSSSNKETLLSIIVIILTIGFLLSIYGSNQEIKEYKAAYSECVDNINRYNNGYQDVWNRDFNITLEVQNEID